WKKVTDVVIKNGIIQNPEVLKVGDALMFKGSDSSRPLGIGHTEMVYEINGKTAASATPAAKKISSKPVRCTPITLQEPVWLLMVYVEPLPRKPASWQYRPL
ncbi:MAG: hypothetical protein PUG03_06095, partial [Oliverpabstia intestinalis]|nr:hypothetical protein [Oliverpabstia intestinalis]